MTHPRFSLLQARDAGEVTKAEELAAFAEKLQVPIEAIRPFDLLSETPSLAAVKAGVDAVLVGGSGRYGIRDDVPWMTPFVRVLEDLAQADVPTFASCFGFQGLILALGGDVESHPSSAEVGTFDVQTTDDASDDPVFSSLPPMFNAQMGHKDSATSFPSAAIHLAGSDRCAFQALRVGTNVYATQFHPELSMQDNRLRYERYYVEYRAAFGEKKAAAIMDSFQPSQSASRLLLDFKNHILG